MSGFVEVWCVCFSEAPVACAGSLIFSLYSSHVFFYLSLLNELIHSIGKMGDEKNLPASNFQQHLQNEGATDP